MIRTCKQLENKLNTINNTTDIKIKKDGSTYIVVMGGYESAIRGYGLKDLVNELKGLETIKMVYRSWTMQGMKVKTIKGIN
jgi:hypothetical protein